MALRFDYPAGKELSIQIFDPIYHGARSLVQLGQFQYDLLGVTPTGLWDFAEREDRFKKFALACAYAVKFLDSMSVSTFEPYTRYLIFLSVHKLIIFYSNIYTWHVLASEFEVVRPLVPS